MKWCSSSLNHPGASQCWHHYAKAKGLSVKRFEFPVRETPNLSEDDLVKIHAQQITDRTRVLVLPHIDNIVGIRHPVKEIAQMARNRGVEYIAVDAAQSVGAVPIHVERSGIDLLAFPCHKGLYGPMGTGALYVRPGLDLDFFREGGTGFHGESEIHPEEMPMRLEGGTHDTQALVRFLLQPELTSPYDQVSRRPNHGDASGVRRITHDLHR